jgi:hypothetical protein
MFRNAYGGGGGGFGGGLGGGITSGSGGNFYSPELSPDFLELPQSVNEKRSFYRFFYRTNEFVGQAIDQHTDLTMSKTRFRRSSDTTNKDLAEQSYDFCTRWAKEINFFETLLFIAHEYWKLGEVFVFMEDNSPDMPTDIRYEERRSIVDDKAVTELIERPDADERHIQWNKKHYKGWSAIKIIPPEQVEVQSFPMTTQKLFELIPDSKTKSIVEEYTQGGEEARRIVESMPDEIVQAIIDGRNLPLETDPYAGSFVYYLARKRSGYEERGHSIIERCMRTLVYADKLRQAQTSIASRHMTPIRIVWVEDGDVRDVEDLREQVDQALQDPDFSIVANYQVQWEEMGPNDRLLELSSEWDQINQKLMAGLGVTQALLTGEGSYSGDRFSLSIINDRYLLFREFIQNFVDNQILKPMCARMGFVETDEDGNETIIHPSLSFSRLALRDNQETFDAMFNLYQKGSLPVDYILDLLNIDPDEVHRKLKEDLFTLKDSLSNEALRSVYSDLGRRLAEETNAIEKISRSFGLKHEPPSEDEGGGGMRFASNGMPLPPDKYPELYPEISSGPPKSQG